MSNPYGRMRSTLEMKHAGVLTAHGFEWEYEPESIRVPGLYYQPDFLITAGPFSYAPPGEVVLEVKGHMDAESAEKCLSYVKMRKGLDVFIVSFETERCGNALARDPWVWTRSEGWMAKTRMHWLMTSSIQGWLDVACYLQGTIKEAA